MTAPAEALARRVNRLTVTRIDPEAFFAEHSVISSELLTLSRHLSGR